MTGPDGGEVWLVRSKRTGEQVVAIRSREQDAWTALTPDRSLIVLPGGTPVRAMSDAPVPVTATWDQRVSLLEPYARPYTGALT